MNSAVSTVVTTPLHQQFLLVWARLSWPGLRCYMSVFTPKSLFTDGKTEATEVWQHVALIIVYVGAGREEGRSA